MVPFNLVVADTSILGEDVLFKWVEASLSTGCGAVKLGMGLDGTLTHFTGAEEITNTSRYTNTQTCIM